MVGLFYFLKQTGERLELKNEGKQDKHIQFKEKSCTRSSIWTLNQYANSDYMPEEGDTTRSRTK